LPFSKRVLFEITLLLNSDSISFDAPGVPHQIPEVTIARSVDRIELSGSDIVNVITKEPVATFASFVSEAGSGWWHIMPKRATFGDTDE
jgi:hypothetical protein